ncbi:MAG: FG-GAP repeat domain-containing protein, partial [Bacteroidota bacterium]
MKQPLMLIGFLLVAFAIPLPAQTYFDPTIRIIPTRPDITTDPCNTSVHRSFVFGFEQLRAGCTGLDLVVAKTTWEQNPFDDYSYWFTYSYNMSGQFDNDDVFWHGTGLCNNTVYVKKLLFGKLRPDLNPPRKDLVVILKSDDPATQFSKVIRNSLVPNAPLDDDDNYGRLDINAVDGAWGAFTANDIREDLALTDPSPDNPRIKIYNNNSGELSDQATYIFPGYVAEKIALSQINGLINADLNLNKLDLIGVDGTTIKIWINDNNNGLPEILPYYQTLQVPFGFIQSLVVADINNDGYNDIIVGANRGVALYLNTGEEDEDGWFQQIADWVYALPANKASRPHLVAVGDIGSPVANGGANVNDGWNDLVIATGVRVEGEHPLVEVFVNQKGAGTPPVYFFSFPHQTFSIIPPVGQQTLCSDNDFQQISLADVQGNGALAIVATLARCDVEKNLYMFLHTPQAQPWNGGWNIAAVSVTVPDYSPSAVFPQRDPNSVLYKFQGGSYVPVTGNLTSNRGYFVKFPTSQPTWPVTYTGTPI